MTACAEVVAAGEGSVIVRREVGADGRSVARVNDRSVTVGGLAALGARLGEIHGQHDQQRLLEPARQLALLDGFGGHAAADPTRGGCPPGVAGDRRRRR